MDELDERLHAEAADLQARAAAVAATETALRDLRTVSDGGVGGPRWIPRAVAVAGIAAAVVAGVVALRQDDGPQSISSASETNPTVTTEFAIPTIAPGPTSAPAETTVVVSTGATTDPTNEPTTDATLSTSTPFTRCDYTDPGKFPISVSRALSCPDGTEVDVSGVFVRDTDGVAWLCDQASGSDQRPCVGEGLRIVGDTTIAIGFYSGVKQGDALLAEPTEVLIVPSDPYLGPVITGNPVSTIPEAIVSGVVHIEGPCVRIVKDATSRIVVWPAGTHWDADRREIVLPDGQAISDGATIEGSGGSYNAGNVPDVSPGAIAALVACLPPGLDSASPDAVVLAFPDSVTSPTMVALTPTS